MGLSMTGRRQNYRVYVYVSTWMFYVVIVVLQSSRLRVVDELWHWDKR